MTIGGALCHQRHGPDHDSHLLHPTVQERFQLLGILRLQAERQGRSGQAERHYH
jgi:hypothetical protein